jgi:hypothetical protein
MCFEYWVLLHFEENETPTMDCDELVRSLKDKEYLPDYSKGTCDFLDVVPHVHKACVRAQKLRSPAKARGELPENQNPCSEVYILISEILSAGES